SFFIHHHPTQLYTLSLHDALPISARPFSSCRETRLIASLYNKRLINQLCLIRRFQQVLFQLSFCLQQFLFDYLTFFASVSLNLRSEEHTSELQSRENLVCRLLLEK